jgi:hypothetical protein
VPLGAFDTELHMVRIFRGKNDSHSCQKTSRRVLVASFERFHQLITSFIGSSSDWRFPTGKQPQNMLVWWAMKEKFAKEIEEAEKSALKVRNQLVPLCNNYFYVN